MDAVEALMRFRIPEADVALRTLSREPGAAPAAHHLLSMSAFLTGLVTDQESDFERFAAHADTLEELLKSAEPSCWTAYMRAETELQRGVAAVKAEQYLKAAWHGRAAYKRYVRAIRDYPDFVELYKGIGLMHLGIGSLPGGWRRFLGILGYRGSVQQGIEELERAARGSVINRDAATLSIGLAKSMLGLDAPGGVARLAEVHRRRPESPFFGYLYAYALIDNRLAAEAEEILSQYAEQRDDGVHQYIDYVDYYLARAHFVQDEFDEAAEHYRVYLANHHGPSLRAAALVGLGMSLEMLGRVDEARAQYQAVRATREYDIDEVARREAARRLREPLTGRRRALLLGANAYDSGRYERATTILTQVFNDPDAEGEERVEAAYRMGRVHHALGNGDAALEAYGYAVENARDPEAKWAPWARLYSGEIYAARGDDREAEEAFRDAMAYRGPFDYQQTLEQSARAAIEKLKASR
ncbi:MAG TPA: tetratricopeptide repeat protein [Rhodothermales bacterium]